RAMPRMMRAFASMNMSFRTAAKACDVPAISYRARVRVGRDYAQHGVQAGVRPVPAARDSGPRYDQAGVRARRRAAESPLGPDPAGGWIAGRPVRRGACGRGRWRALCRRACPRVGVHGSDSVRAYSRGVRFLRDNAPKLTP